MKIIQEHIYTLGFWIAAALGAAAFLVIVVVVTNFQTLASIVMGPLGFLAGIKIFFSLFGNLVSNATTLGFILMIITVFLFGINMGLIRSLINKQLSLLSHSGAAGSVAGIFGTGCTACGSALFTGIFGAGGATLLSSLPLHGQEIAILAIILLVYSIYGLTERLGAPQTCSID